MNIASAPATPWLLLVFSLPTKSASARVGIWRKLQKFGAIGFRNSGYLLPNDATNRERFEWLARSVRDSHGEASVLQVRTIDDLPEEAIQEQFRKARDEDYRALLTELRSLKRIQSDFSVLLTKARQRLEEIVAIDFFENPLRGAVEETLMRLTKPKEKTSARSKQKVKSEYQDRLWVTRPRPGIDRVSSAWLIARFIDDGAQFAFASDASKVPSDGIAFDMYSQSGFGHEGDNCTFETLCKHFGIKDKAVRVIAEAIHDADLEDGRFGRSEGTAINSILRGWDRQGLPDSELLKRGMELIEGLYLSLSGAK